MTLLKEIKGLNDSQLINLFNDYQSQTYGGIFIKENTQYELKEHYSNIKDLLKDIYSNGFSLQDDYFYFDNLGKLRSFSDLQAIDSPIYVDDIINWIEQNDLQNVYF